MEVVMFVAACCTIASFALSLFDRCQRRKAREKKMKPRE